MVAATVSETRAEARFFYVWMAGVCVLITFGAFAGTYWLQLAPGTFIGAPLLHLHGVVFSLWSLLLLSQTWRAANGRLTRHRAWGVAGVSLATAMVALGLAVALHVLKQKLGEGYGDRARAFMWLPLGSLTMFAAFFAAAVLNVSRPEWHKRLILVATCAALLAAAARIGFLIATGGGGPGLRPSVGAPPAPSIALGDAGIMSLVLLAGAAYDWRTRGRPHPAYLIGLATFAAWALLGQVVAVTPAWYAAMDALAAFGR